MKKNIWQVEKVNMKIEDCYFYHTMDIPKHGTVIGEWDLRGNEDNYLGKINFKNTN